MTNQFDVSDHFDETLADKYDNSIRMFCPGYDALHRMMIPFVKELPHHANFLSSGAGTGTEIVTLSKRFPTWRFTAVDPSEDMLNICRKRIEQANGIDRVSFFTGTMQEYENPIAFDAASSIFVSHFIKNTTDKLAYFRSIASCLKPGGVFILADLFGDTNSAEFSPLLDALLASYASHGIAAEKLAQDRAHVEHDIGYRSEYELMELLEQAGFSKPIRFFQSYLFGGWVMTKKDEQ